jgi:hypothetical protein
MSGKPTGPRAMTGAERSVKFRRAAADKITRLRLALAEATAEVEELRRQRPVEDAEYAAARAAGYRTPSPSDPAIGGDIESLVIAMWIDAPSASPGWNVGELLARADTKENDDAG